MELSIKWQTDDVSNKLVNTVEHLAMKGTDFPPTLAVDLMVVLHLSGGQKHDT